MITKVIMPQMSLTMQVGIVSQWFKSEGESVVSGEPICTVEGDKASVDIEAPATGILKKIVAPEGAEFPVKETMAYIGNLDDVIEVDSMEDKKLAVKTEADGLNSSKPESKLSHNRINASPIAKRLAKEKGIDLSKVKGSGPDGLISKDDVLAFVGTSHASLSDDTSRELNDIEKIIAEKMAKSNQEIPHFHLSVTCNLTPVNKLRKEANQKNADKQNITLTDILIWAVSRSLRKFTDLNSSYQPNKIIFNKKINIGLAVNTPNGLLVVVIKEADEKSIFEIREIREERTQRAMAGKQRPEDLAEGTFTISNLGMFGIESFDPIIIPGQVGILGVGALVNSLELDNEGTVHVVEKLTMTLGCDHRAIDGVAGAEFLSNVKSVLENFSDMFQDLKTI